MTTIIMSPKAVATRLNIFLRHYGTTYLNIYERLRLIAPEIDLCFYRLAVICPDTLCDAQGISFIHKALIHTLTLLKADTRQDDALYLTCAFCKHLAITTCSLMAFTLKTDRGEWNLDLAVTTAVTGSIFDKKCVIYGSLPYQGGSVLIKKLTQYLLTSSLLALSTPLVPIKQIE